jgi:hypothetical protein
MPSAEPGAVGVLLGITVARPLLALRVSGKGEARSSVPLRAERSSVKTGIAEKSDRFIAYLLSFLAFCTIVGNPTTKGSTLSAVFVVSEMF